MSFRILFADDSMTAQNMGKKILTDAGYDVVAVSNGAAAVKKIAEHKPDIIILDIYMPGYSGLEVCDKVRASVDTLKTPVLLTVGKMEPYKPEDANRVRADGVIIKPFEASDLLAVIKKLEERVIPKTIAMAQDTVLLERPPDFAEFDAPAANDMDVNSARTASAVQATVDVPDNMATTAAFSDMLGADSAYSLDPLPVPQSVSVAEPEVLPEPPAEAASPVAESAPVRVERVAEPWPPEPKPVVAGPTETSLESPVEFVPEPTFAKSSGNGVGEWPAVAAAASAPAVEEEIGHTIETAVEAGFAVPEAQPVASHQEPEASVVSHAGKVQPEPETAVTAANGAATPEAEVVTHEPSASSVEPHKYPDPGLAIDVISFEQTAKAEAETVAREPELETFEAAKMEAETSQAPVAGELQHASAAAETAPSDDDFEARVAAAMTIYDAPAEEKVDEWPSPAAEAQPVAGEAVREAAPAPAEEVTPSFEYTPPVNPPQPIDVQEAAFLTGRQFKESPVNTEKMLVTTEATMVIPVYLEPPTEPKHEEPAPAPQVYAAASAGPVTAPAVEQTVPAVEQSMESRIEAAIPAVAAAAAASTEIGADTQMITAVVDRILERLKPQMIEEISRELKTKKTT